MTGTIHPMVPAAVLIRPVPVLTPELLSLHSYLDYLNNRDMHSYNNSSTSSYDPEYTDDYTEDNSEYSDNFSDDSFDTILVYLM